MRILRNSGARCLAAVATLIALPMSACDLGVIDPDIITPDNLTGEAALPTIRAAALGDFALAYTGSGADGSRGTEGIATASGMLADEFVNSETFPTRVEIDRRSTQVTNGTLTGWFRTLSRARRSQEFAAANFRTLATDTTLQSGLAEMLSLSGYTYLFFAENYCSGVPFSTANADGSLVFGDPLTTAQMLDTAEARFRAAVAAATALQATVSARANMINLASIGLGRALLDQGDFANAAAAVTAVPTTFVYSIGHSQNNVRQENGIYNATVFAERYAVADGEGGNGIRFRTSSTGAGVPVDGRVPHGRFPASDAGFDGTTPQWDPQRFGDVKAPNPLATGAEARLIEAEAALVAGDTVGGASGWITIHNTLRAAAPSYFAPVNETRAIAIAYGTLPALTATDITTLGGVVNLHFREREFWLWLSGHRLGDLRRLTHAPYNRGGETVFPTGAYFKGGVYGTDYNFPVPFDETNNPNFTQCIDRNP
jgi:hypothetical protein